MGDIIGREYCLKNPAEIIRLFGVRVFLSILFCSNKSLLQQVIASYVSHIYKKMSAKFKDNTQVRDFYAELQREEEEHARLMLLCLYTVSLKPSVHYVPSIRDKAIRRVTGYLRDIERSIDGLSLSIEKHNSQGVAVAGHHDCAGNPAGQDDQIAHIQKAIDLLRSHHEEVETVGPWVDENREVHEIGQASFIA